MRAAASGRGGLTLVEGEAGIGKSSVLAFVRDHADELGVVALDAVGHELEQRHAYGVARQLLDGVRRAVDDPALAEITAGVAALALPLLDREPPAVSPASEDGQGLLYGTYWLLSNLADRRPVVLLVDDGQWVDPPSSALIDYVARRAGDLPLHIVVARRPLPERADDAITVAGEKVTLPPLTRAGIERMTARALPDSDAGPLAAAVEQATGGNPLYVTTLIAEIADRGLAPDPEAVRTILADGAGPIVASVGRRLAALPGPALEVAEALAVLGDGAPAPRVAALAGTTATEVALAADALRTAGVLAAGDRLGFRHPVIAGAVLARLPAGEQAAAHARAAELAIAAGDPAEQVADHLVRAPAGAVEGAAAALAEAARSARARAAHTIAADLLDRALEEPAAAAMRLELLLDLGTAQGLTASERMPQTMQQAMQAAAGPADRARVAARQALLQYRAGRGAAALADLRAALGDPATPAGARRAVAAQVVALACLDGASRVAMREGEVDEALALLGSEDGPHAALYRASMAVVDYADVAAARAATQAALGPTLVGLAGNADGEALPPELFVLLVTLLTTVEEYELVIQLCEGGLAAAAQLGDAVGYAYLGAAHMSACLRAGALGEAMRTRAVIAEQADALLPWVRAWSLGAAQLAVDELEPGMADGDENAISRQAIVDGLTGAPPGSTQEAMMLLLRGMLRLRGGDVEAGLQDALHGDALAAGLGFPTGGFHVRSVAAMVLLLAGRREEGAALAHDELARNARWGAPGAHGVSLRTVALLAPAEEERLDGLRASADLLATSNARLEHARTLGELGAALRRANRRAEAREKLREAIEVADACAPGTLVAAQARVELAASGGRPPAGRPVTGREALTASERRVAELVAAGQSNPEVAQALFISRRTVESHLARAYRKLGIEGRAQLAQALEDRHQIATTP